MSEAKSQPKDNFGPKWFLWSEFYVLGVQVLDVSMVCTFMGGGSFMYWDVSMVCTFIGRGFQYSDLELYWKLPIACVIYFCSTWCLCNKQIIKLINFSYDVQQSWKKCHYISDWSDSWTYCILISTIDEYSQ